MSAAASQSSYAPDLAPPPARGANIADGVPDPEGALIVEGECVSCTCTQEHACDPPCAWDEACSILPLCSNCAPPAAIVVDDLDVEDLVLDAIDQDASALLGTKRSEIIERVAARFDGGDVPEGAVDLALMLLVEDGLVDTLDEERDGDLLFQLASRRGSP